MNAGLSRELTFGRPCPSSHSRWSSSKSLRVVRTPSHSFSSRRLCCSTRILQHWRTFCYLWHWSSPHQPVSQTARQQAVLLRSRRRWSQPEEVSYQWQRRRRAYSALCRRLWVSPRAYTKAGPVMLIRVVAEPGGRDGLRKLPTGGAPSASRSLDQDFRRPVVRSGRE